MIVDNLGQPITHSLADPDNVWDRIDTSYDGLGQVSFRSYPCAASSSGGPPVCTAGDTFSYDALGRPTTVTHSDGTQILTSYKGAATEIQDEGNAVDSSGNVTQRVTRILQRDGLGRLTNVCEVSPSLTVGSDPSNADCHLDIDNLNGSGSTALDGFLTTYQYNALGNLIQASQGSETRTFTYDSLSRLLSADNPESGMTTYVYDANGNVTTKTDANQTVTTYQYDSLNRVVTKTYTLPNPNPYGVMPTSQVNFSYDIGCPGCNTIGRLTGVTNGAVVLNWTSFDSLGRPEAMATTVNGTTYSSNVSYDLLGFPTWELLPSGRQLYLTENTAGRPLWIGDGQYAGFNFIAARYYNAAGQPDDEKLGNGLLQGWHHDTRGRLVKMTLEDPNNPAYANWRMDMDIDRLPDSDVSAIVDNMGTGADDQSYSYDPLNRLVEWTSDWGGVDCAFAPDRYGNLALNSSGSSSACHMPAGLSFNGNNQIVGDSYDSDGNLLSDGSGQQWSWNAENQLAQYQVTSPTSNAQYLYDGLGRRTEETVDGVTTLYLRNALGRVVDEVSGSSWTDSIIVPGAERMAIVSGPADGTPGGTDHVYYLTADQVGTTRVITKQDGTNDASCGQNSTYAQGSFFTFTPFGAELNCSQSTTDFKFTGKPRDPETGLDYFGARYNSSQLGRFMTPDPIKVNPPRLINPQRWNEYAYAVDNPILYTDPTGRDAIAVNFVDEVPFGGHEGIIVVDPSTGVATYARFGPKGGGALVGTGAVQRQRLTSLVKYGADQLPTAASYRTLANEVAKIEGQKPDTVGFQYIRTTEAETQALEAWIMSEKARSDAHDMPEYEFNKTNCALFCIAGLTRAGALHPGQPLSIVPNRLWMLLLNWVSQSWSNGTVYQNVTHKIHYCGGAGSPPCAK